MNKFDKQKEANQTFYQEVFGKDGLSERLDSLECEVKEDIYIRLNKPAMREGATQSMEQTAN